MTTRADLPTVLQPLHPELERVDAVLHETLASVEEPLRSALHFAVGGGKRIRPALVLLTGQMFAVPAVPFYQLAAALEMLHVATLIHDDVIDGAATRRGHDTLHEFWPVRAAVLAGDYLLAQAAAMIADLEYSRISKSFAEVLTTMCAGEIRQTLVTEGKFRHREDYYRSIEAKTASLFAGSLVMAGLLAMATEPQIILLRRFGREIGLAFQIMDDVLDLIGDGDHMGKVPGSDLSHGLVTLPTVLYLEQTRAETAVHRVLAGTCDAECVQMAVAELHGAGAIEAARDVALQHVRTGQAALADLPQGPPRQMISTLAEYVVARKR